MDFTGFTLTERLIAAIVAVIIAGFVTPLLSLFKQLGFKPSQTFTYGVRLLERKLNRTKRSTHTRLVRGAIMIFALSFIAWLVGFALSTLETPSRGSVWLQAFLLGLLLPVGLALSESRKIFRLLNQPQIRLTRAMLRTIAKRNTALLDGHGVVRTTVEYMAVHFSEYVIAPLFWYFIFGLPGLCITLMITFVNDHIGYRSLRYSAYGWTTLKLYALLHFIPSRIAAMILATASSFTPNCNGAASWHTMLTEGGKIYSSYAGYPIAAMAGAMNISLAGPRSLHATFINDVWLGNGTIRAELGHMKQMMLCYVLAMLCTEMLLAVLLACTTL